MQSVTKLSKFECTLGELSKPYCRPIEVTFTAMFWNELNKILIISPPAYEHQPVICPPASVQFYPLQIRAYHISYSYFIIRQPVKHTLRCNGRYRVKKKCKEMTKKGHIRRERTRHLRCLHDTQSTISKKDTVGTCPNCPSCRAPCKQRA